MTSRAGEDSLRQAEEDAFLHEMNTGWMARAAAVLCLFLAIAVSPVYGLAFIVPHGLLCTVLFVLCARAGKATGRGRGRLMVAAVAARTLLVVHVCLIALDLRFGHRLQAEATLLVTALLVLAALQAQPSRAAYVLGLFPPVVSVLLIVADRPGEDARTALAMLLLVGVIVTAAIRHNGLARRTHQLQVRSDRMARAQSQALGVADLAEEVAQIGHWRNGPDGQHVWSAGVFRIFGLEPAEQPPPLDEALAFYTPEGRAEIAALVADAQANKRGFRFEHTLIRRDGSRRRIAVQALWRSGDSLEGGWLLGVAQDVTDAREAERALARSEARFRLLAENASDMIVQVGLDGGLGYISPACEAISGYPPAFLVGRPVTELIFEDDQPELRRRIEEALATRSPHPWSAQYRIRRKDGAVIWLDSHACLTFDETGEVTGITDVLRDATARREMEQALVAARRAAEASAQAEADFLANMSHELRTPLNSIVGFSRLLADAPELTTETRRRAALVRDASGALVAIVNDVLDVSRFEAEGVTLTPEPVDLNDLVTATTELVRGEAEAKGVDLVLDLPLVPERVLADPTRLRQTLLNLIGNAVKFTDTGTVTVSLGADSRGKLRFAVKDTGIGIAPDRQSTIFNRFVQADRSVVRRFGGSGLGLAISKTIVEAMGGEIGVFSAEGAGSTFWFTVDLAPAPSLGWIEATTPKGSVAQGARVLLVDDNGGNCELFHALLEPAGVDVTCASGGTEGLALVRTAPFDVVFMDVQMPGMDGLEATRRIRALGFGRLPIVALTANVMTAQIEACREAGMDDHLGKPFSARELLDSIVRWIGREGSPAAGEASPTLAVLQQALGPDKLTGLLSTLEAQLAELVALLRAEPPQAQALAAQAHSLRGYAGSLGFPALHTALQELEQACAEGGADARTIRAALDAATATQEIIARRAAA